MITRKCCFENFGWSCAHTAAIWQANTRTTSAPLDSAPWGCKNYHWLLEEFKLPIKVNNCLNMIFHGFGCAQGTCKWMPFWLPNMQKVCSAGFCELIHDFSCWRTVGESRIKLTGLLAHQKGTVPHCSGTKPLRTTAVFAATQSHGSDL